MIRGLFGRLLAAMCGVAAASTALVLLLQERSLSDDLERAAQERLDNAAAAAERLLESHLGAMSERYQAISGTPQFRATLEIDDAATLAHYAESLLEQHDAARIAFVHTDGGTAAAAGASELDEALLGIATSGLVAQGGRAFAAVSTPVAGAGRLVAAELLDEETLAIWSELCGAEVSFEAPGSAADAEVRDEIQRSVLSLDGLELRVTSSLQAERTAMRNARVHLGMAAALALAVAFAVSFVFSRGLVRPIREVRVAARQIGSGDLTQRLEAGERADEIGDVVRAFGEMTHQLASTIRQVAEAADRVEATAGGISGASGRFLAVAQEQQRGNDEAATTLTEIEQLIERVAKSAGESAQSLDLSVDGQTASFRQLAESGEALREDSTELSLRTDEIIHALEQVTERSVQVADDAERLLPATELAASSAAQMAAAARSVNKNAEETARLSSGVVDTAERGRQIVRDAVTGMQATRDTIEESERVIQGLRERAGEIGSILTVIDDVSEETNLLALNAAIIAAQAGERGRAFAVVADEMKAVCERVQAGTREIEAVVRAVQEETANAVASIARGAARAREGAGLIRQAEASLVEITQAARESGDHMTESASSTAQQLVAAAAVVEHLETLRTGVDSIREVTRAQVQANAGVQRGSSALHAVSERMRSAVDLQTNGTARIGQSVEDVQQTVREITHGLAQQGSASRDVSGVVRRSMELTRSHEASAAEIATAVADLERQAEALREAVRRFRV